MAGLVRTDRIDKRTGVNVGEGTRYSLSGFVAYKVIKRLDRCPGRSWVSSIGSCGRGLGNIPCSVVVHTAQKAVQEDGSGASWYENGILPVSKGDHAPVRQILTEEHAAETSALAQLRVGDVRIKLRVSWVDDIPGDLTDLRAIGTNGQAELQGLFGYSPDRRIPYQRCRLRKDGELPVRNIIDPVLRLTVMPLENY